MVAVGTQGENLGEGGRFGGHGGLDRAVALVPLILRAPHGAGAGRIRGTATGADLLPTLMRVLGLEPIEGLDGVPFPTESADAPRVAVCEANDAEEVGLFSGDLAWVRCIEVVSSLGDRGTAQGRVAATNLFSRVDGRWRMVLHHGSPIAVDLDD